MNEPRELGQSFLAPLQRHFINLMCLDSGPAAKKKYAGKSAVYNFSAFVVEIKECWFAISAGHIFRDLKEAISLGAIISDWQIDDSIVSATPQQAYRIPLDIEKDVLWIYDAASGIDYACVELRPLTQAALHKEGIRAISQSLWTEEDIARYTLWLLVGTPSQFAELEAGKPIVKNHVTIQLERVNDVPRGLNESEFRRLYAKIHFDSVMNQESGFNIEGMSGGPIFGLLPDTSNCQYEYRLIGVQSAWNNEDHVAICAAYPFLQTIAKQVDARHEAVKNDV